MGSRDRTNLLHQKNRNIIFGKRNEEPIKIELKKPNHTIQGKYSIPWNDPRQQIELGREY